VLLTAFVLQITPLTVSPGLGSDQFTVNVVVLFAATGSGESVTEETLGEEFVTVKLPEVPLEHAFSESHTNAQYVWVPMSFLVVVKPAVAGLAEDKVPTAQAPPVQLPALTEFVLQITPSRCRRSWDRSRSR
jgi:hypothetical protein